MFIESLKRLFDTNKINEDKLKQLVLDKKITTKDFNFITGKVFVN